MGSPRITYVARPNATPETELSALATVYKFVLSKSTLAKKPSSPPQSPTATTRRRSGNLVDPRRWRTYGRWNECWSGCTDEGEVTM